MATGDVGVSNQQVELDGRWYWPDSYGYRKALEDKVAQLEQVLGECGLILDDTPRVTVTLDGNAYWEHSQEYRDALLEKIDRQAARIQELRNHLDWIGWSAEGVLRAKRQVADLERCAAAQQRQLDTLGEAARILRDLGTPQPATVCHS